MKKTFLINLEFYDIDGVLKNSTEELKVKARVQKQQGKEAPYQKDIKSRVKGWLQKQIPEGWVGVLRVSGENLESFLIFPK